MSHHQTRSQHHRGLLPGPLCEQITNKVAPDVRTQAPTNSPDARTARELTHLATTLGSSLLAATPLPNATGKDRFRFPSGVIVALQPNAPLTAELLNTAPLTAVATCRIMSTHTTPEHATDAYYTSKLPQLQSTMATHSKLAPSLFAKTTIEAQSGARVILTADDTHWEPELGIEGNIGVYKAIPLNHQMWAATAADTAQHSQSTAHHYYLSVTAGLDSLYYDEYYAYWKSQLESANEPITVEQLQAHATTARLHNLVQRNATRLLMSAAQTLGVAVNYQNDHDSIYHTTGVSGPPICAVADHLQLQNAVNRVQTQDPLKSESAIVFYSGATMPPKAEYSDPDARAVLNLGPQDGLIFVANVVNQCDSTLWGGFPAALDTVSLQQVVSATYRQTALTRLLQACHASSDNALRLLPVAYATATAVINQS